MVRVRGCGDAIFLAAFEPPTKDSIMDAFANVFGQSRGATLTPPSAPTDGRPAPMSTEEILATVKFLAPEVADRAQAHTKA